MFRSTDGGQSWHELAGLRGHGTGPQWQPGAGGMGLHTILIDPKNHDRMFIAISAAGCFPHATMAARLGSRSIADCDRNTFPIPMPKSATASTASRMHPTRPDVLFMQKHWDVMRSDDGGDNWHEVSGNLPTDFGFPIEVHAHEPETVLRRPDHKRLTALPAGRQAARVPQPHRRQRLGTADATVCRKRTAT